MLKVFTSKMVNGEEIISPFPSVSEQVEIATYEYNAVRMGGAPQITAKFKHSQCLDKLWNEQQFVEFNGARYYVSFTPSSLKNNEDSRYEYDVTFVSERKILEEVYMIDAVVKDPNTNQPLTDKYVSNTTKVTFWGNIEEYVGRLNACLFSHLLGGTKDGGYYVVIDNMPQSTEKYSTEELLVSFEDKKFSEALQEIFTTFELPYYWEGKVCHVGYADKTIDHEFEYGRNESLLSIERQNTNEGKITRATGTGSSDNLSYYYPNQSPSDSIKAHAVEGNKGITSDNVISIVNADKFARVQTVDEAQKPWNNSAIRFWDGSKYAAQLSVGDCAYTNSIPSDTSTKENKITWGLKTKITRTGEGFEYLSDKWWEENYTAEKEDADNKSGTTHFYDFNNNMWEGQELPRLVGVPANITLLFPVDITKRGDTARIVFGVKFSQICTLKDVSLDLEGGSSTFQSYWNIKDTEATEGIQHFAFDCSGLSSLSGKIVLRFTAKTELPTVETSTPDEPIEITVSKPIISPLESRWYNEYSGWTLYEARTLKSYGLSVPEGTVPQDGDRIVRLFDSVKAAEILPVSQTLLPSVYRTSGGTEMFLNATNSPDATIEDIYTNPETSEKYSFVNEYDTENPHEAKYTFEDIKPTIKGMLNKDKKRIDTFLDVEFDLTDNDYIKGSHADEANDEKESESDMEYMHPYFFVKLPKTNNANGFDFNLFEIASASGDSMTLSMTSGQCGGCNFQIMVDNDTLLNTVQVYEEDTTDEHGTYKAGDLKRDSDGNVLFGAPQDRQQDTKNNEVWVALLKEEDTYGIIMPNHQSKLSPKEGDTFVILNADMPFAYVRDAEVRLSKAIVEQMWKDNTEKFSFSINLSRIFLEENKDILERLTENSRIYVKYNNEVMPLFVNSYSYKKDASSILPEISIDLKDTIEENTAASSDSSQDINEPISRGGIGGLLDIIGTEDTDRTATNGNVFSALRSLEEFLSKKTNDNAEGHITFKQGITALKRILSNEGISSEDFLSSVSGYMLGNQNNGDSYLEVDNLKVRKMATFFELMIQKVQHSGGEIIISPAASVISDVELLYENPTDTKPYKYRCFIQTERDGIKIQNPWRVGALALCKNFDVTRGSTYYWREVVAVGDNYVDLANYIDDGWYRYDPAIDLETNTTPSTPAKGHEIVQFGASIESKKDAKCAIVISSVGSNAPSIRMYQNIEPWGIPDPVSAQEYNPETQRMIQKVLGDFYYGDAAGNAYVKFNVDNGLEIKAKSIVITSEDKTLNVEDAINELGTENGFVVWQADNDAEKVSGVIVPEMTYDAFSWLPSIEWSEELQKHVGDFLITSDGIAYEFRDSYKWVIVTDQYLISYVQDLYDAKKQLSDLADDGIITPSEKKTLGSVWLQVKAEYETLINDTKATGISTEKLSTAYSTLSDIIVPILDTPNQNSTINRGEFYTAWDDYYTQEGGIKKRLSERNDKVVVRSLMLNFISRLKSEFRSIYDRVQSDIIEFSFFKRTGSSVTPYLAWDGTYMYLNGIRLSSIDSSLKEAIQTLTAYVVLIGKTIRIYKGTPSSSVTPSLYDISIKTFGEDKFEEVSMYDGSNWVVIGDDTRANVEILNNKIKISVEGIDSRVGVLEESGFIAEKDFAEVFSKAVDEDGILTEAKVVTYVKEGDDNYVQSGVKIKGDNIELEGTVTANENFKILTDGSMEAKNGKFSGKISAQMYYGGILDLGNISSDYVIDLEKDATTSIFIDRPIGRGSITLPSAKEYDGLELNITGIMISRNTSVDISTNGYFTFYAYDDELEMALDYKFKTINVSGSIHVVALRDEWVAMNYTGVIWGNDIYGRKITLKSGTSVTK